MRYIIFKHQSGYIETSIEYDNDKYEFKEKYNTNISNDIIDAMGISLFYQMYIKKVPKEVFLLARDIMYNKNNITPRIYRVSNKLNIDIKSLIKNINFNNRLIFIDYLILVLLRYDKSIIKFIFRTLLLRYTIINTENRLKHRFN